MRDTRAEQAPCHLDPRFLQPGDEPDWHLFPETIQAVAVCETICPISHLVRCARAALRSGQLATEPEVTLPADGVIAAGIICRGDNDTALTLREVINRYGRPEDCIPVCPGCERRLVLAGEPLGLNEARLAARGLCKGCYSATARSGQLTKVYQLRPDHCADCKRPLVGREDPVPEGHARFHSDGRCLGCQSTYRRASRKAA
ncbi:hypothetical protein [Nocardia panacis]|uniref:hypothetical protein n=1 Tax=Nocardia panacis TaxID=2340916 RepID=UPI0011C36732|nr:hypothetical protein [Nocardia panacis]